METKHKLYLWGSFLFLGLSPVQASLSQDSIRIESLLHTASLLPADSCRMLFYGKAFLDTPYAAGTLEKEGEERLVVRLDSLDCTTFVETVLALVITEQQKAQTYNAFIRNLTRIRYRNGIINGYASRLHYFSDWVKDNETKGIIYERSRELSSVFRTLSLSFMTTHTASYPALRNNMEEVKKIRTVEAKWQHTKMYYIPKTRLSEPPHLLDIHNGDIIALTTSIKGLDVVHMGLAYWIDGYLHLLHASSAKGQVILDPISLYEYTKNKNAHTGIRVVSVCASSL